MRLSQRSEASGWNYLGRKPIDSLSLGRNPPDGCSADRAFRVGLGLSPSTRVLSRGSLSANQFAVLVNRSGMSEGHPIHEMVDACHRREPSLRFYKLLFVLIASSDLDFFIVELLYYILSYKGQIISKCLYGVIVSTRKPTQIF